jgi:hypothetical protein
MFRSLLIPACSLFATAAISADQPATSAAVAATAVTASENKAQGERAPSNAKADAGPKALSGMSILGNQEAPKALVIVPWKSSQLGDAIGISKTLDDGRQPVDKDVFMRQLSYYEIRTKSK